MSLSKQLYIIIAFIFFIIFTGNFFISIKNTKEYLEIEATTKAQDTATSLGMSLKPLIKDKYDPEITSVIRAISNSGFYKEIRLEDADFTITEQRILDSSKEFENGNWKIVDLSVDKKFGKIEKKESDNLLNEQLSLLENDNKTFEVEESSNNSYKFIPSIRYKNGGTITFNVTATNTDKKIDTQVILTIEKVIVKETRDIKFEYVPQWFVDLIPINLEERFSEISQGWNTDAIIYVSSNPGEAYAKLFEQAKNSTIYSVVAFIISMLILLVFVQYLLRPLKKIESLAKDIAKGKFGVIEQIPWTIEIKNVAIAMNEMSSKIEAIINKLNNNLENFSKKLSEDNLTKLPLKSSFETDIKQMFIHKNSGFIFTIKIDNLGNFAKTHTNDEIDNFIIEFSDILKNLSNNLDKPIEAYRFFGSEFAMIAKEYNCEEIEKICNILKGKFTDFALTYNVNELVHVGVTPFNELSNIDEILQASNEAYEKAKLIGPNEFFISNNSCSSRDMNTWRDLIFDIVDNASFDIDFVNNAYDINDDKKLCMQEIFTVIKDKEKNPIPIGSFVSIAEKYEKIIDFDKNVVSKVIKHMVINGIKHNICINLSPDSIADNNFIIWLQKEITKNREISSNLVFSITAYSAAKHIDIFKNFCEYIHSCGAKVIVKRFESKFIPIDTLKELNLDFIRLARDYTTSIDSHTDKINFIESICELGELLNIKILAESVKNERDLNILKKYKIYAVSR